MTSINVEGAEGGEVGLRFAYNPELQALLKRRGFGIRWDKAAKRWVLHLDAFWPLAKELRAEGHQLHCMDQDLLSHMRAERARIDTMPQILFSDDVPWEQPAALRTELRPYQRVGATALHTVRGGVLLADPVGTGKTITCITDMLLHGVGEEPDQYLFLTPATLKWNTLQQLERHTEGLAATVVDGPRSKREAQWAEPTPIKIAGYEGYLRADWDIAPHEWRRVYADEVTKVKNTRTRLSQRLQRVRAEHGVVGLTATPIEMRLEELYGVFKALRGGLLGRWSQFRDAYLEVDHWGTVTGVHDLDDLQERIGPYMVRRRKEDLLPQLPPKTAVDVDLHLSSAEARLYAQLEDEFVGWLLSHDRSLAEANVLTQMLRLRQALDCPALLGEEYPEDCTKLTAVSEIVESAGEKVVVFTQWAEMAKVLHHRLGGHLVTGQTPTRRRLETVNAFNEDDERVLVSTDALAHGVDIVGASTVVHYDQLWNPAKMVEQREGRLHRIGQERPVTAITLYHEGTIEETMQDILSARSALAARMYDGTEAQMLARWTADEWRGALKGRAPE